MFWNAERSSFSKSIEPSGVPTSGVRLQSIPMSVRIAQPTPRPSRHLVVVHSYAHIVDIVATIHGDRLGLVCENNPGFQYSHIWDPPPTKNIWRRFSDVLPKDNIRIR